MLDGMAEIAEQIFDQPIRRGYPMGVGGLIDHVSSPEFATAVGLVMYAHRNHADDARMPTGGALSRVAVKLRGLFCDRPDRLSLSQPDHAESGCATRRR